MEEYSVEIIESSRDFTPRERLKIMRNGQMLSMDSAIEEAKANGATLEICPVDYAVVKIFNPIAKGDKEYEKFVVFEKGGAMFCTGSKSFFTSFKVIWDTMKETDEEYSIELFKRESKNYPGKTYIDCAIV